jgi:tRNA pseudouridine38-40 synthase
MPTYKLMVAYDGTSYSGWQKQKNAPSVCHAMQRAFATIFNTECRLLGASRTDAGVHAFGQVVRCITSLEIDPERLKQAWNNGLPDSITIRAAVRVADTFHPMHNVIEKEYHYHIFTERALPFVAAYGWHYKGNFDWEYLTELLQLFVGTHDFTSFCAVDVVHPTMIRTINAIKLFYCKEWNAHRIMITGHSFLRHMIRRIVGAALVVSQDKHYSIDFLRAIFMQRNARHILPNAPSKGLMLYSITYKEPHNVSLT